MAADKTLVASQVKELGIDVLVFHPSPVATRFYDKASVLLPRPCRLPAQLPVPPHEHATARPLCTFPAPCYMQVEV